MMQCVCLVCLCVCLQSLRHAGPPGEHPCKACITHGVRLCVLVCLFVRVCVCVCVF